MTKEKFVKISSERAKRSDIFFNVLKAFVSGGLICVFAHFLYELYLYFEISEENSRLLSTVTIIFLAGFFTGIGIFDKAAKECGAGTLVPITGFSNAVSAPAIESKSEGFINGVGAKMFVIAGPVIVYGTLASFIYGLVYYYFLK